jgi:peptide/nickel transport system permease protein
MMLYILRRLLINVPILLGTTVLIFTFLLLAPGDPVSAYIKPELGDNPVMRETLRKELGLDQPAPVRYVRWLSLVLQGNLGYRAVGGQPVNEVVGRALRASLVLMGTALAIGCLVGIPFGIISALRQYSKLDFALTALAYLGVSTPSFLLGLGGLYLLGLKLGLLPIGGMATPSQPFSMADFLRHLALPALILSFGYIAILMRYTRSSMLEVISATYITTARAKGLQEKNVVLVHAFRNALIPIITVIGLALPEMVGGR